MKRIALATVLVLVACKKDKAKPAEQPPQPVPVAQVDAAAPAPPTSAVDERSAEDQALDEGRKPAEMVAFLGVKPGMNVYEILAGGGYTTEVLARAVAPGGKVYGQNTKAILEKFAEGPWSARLKKPSAASIVRVDRELDDPFPPEAKELDLVVSNLVYHDLVWLGVDRAKLNAAVFAALKPGGAYYIADHHAAAGAGLTVVQTLHRIEPAEVRKEVEAAGFVLEKEADFLRNPADTRDWSTSPGAAGEKRGTSDRFVLLFRKP